MVCVGDIECVAVVLNECEAGSVDDTAFEAREAECDSDRDDAGDTESELAEPGIRHRGSDIGMMALPIQAVPEATGCHARKLPPAPHELKPSAHGEMHCKRKHAHHNLI